MNDTYTPVELMSVVSDPNDNRFRFRPLFVDMFFPEVATFKTRKIMLDELDIEHVVMSPFCSPMVGSQVMRERGYEARDFMPGYMKPKHSIDPSKTVVRLPGESPEQLLSPSYRRTRLVSNALKRQLDAIKARTEWLAVNAITTGKNVIEGDGVERYEIDWGINAANIITQAGPTAWSAQDTETFDPTFDIELYAAQANGPVNVMIMGGTVWRILRTFKRFNEHFDILRGGDSRAELALKDLGDVVSFKGYWGDVALMVYSGKYQDEEGTEHFYLDPYSFVLGHTANRGVVAYGAIQEQNAIREGITEAQYYPRNWIQDGDPAIEFIQTHSAPQPVPVNINRFVTVKVA